MQSFSLKLQHYLTKRGLVKLARALSCRLNVNIFVKKSEICRGWVPLSTAAYKDTLTK